MKNWIVRLPLAVSFLVFSLALSAHAAEPAPTPTPSPLIPTPYVGKTSGPNTRVTYPSTLTVEVLGRGMVWSVGFDQVMSSHFSVGVGFGTAATELNGNDTDRTAKILPIWLNYYFMEGPGSVFVTGGANVIFNSKDVKNDEATVSGVKFPSDAVMPTFGLGYEHRTDTGFLFRATAYGLVGDDIAPWVGFTFGLGF